MRVCLIGDFSAHLDEGFKNVTRHLARGLSRYHELVRLNVKQPLGPVFWSSQLPKPDVVHYLSAPTAPTFLLLGLIRLRWPEVPTVVSALHPSSFSLENSVVLRWLVGISHPTLVLVQNPRSADMFRKLGCRTRYLPNGVDIARFAPATGERRDELRRKHGLLEEQYIVLHVGHLRRERNLEVMSRLQAPDTQVLIIGGTYLGEDRQLTQRLEDQGCLVWRGYSPRIEEIYALADAFVFPTSVGGSLFMPLSAMEAMACNLPVVSTPFEGLLHCFQATPGLIFTSEDDIPRALQWWRRSGLTAGTREKVEMFSWARVVSRLECIYHDVVSGG
jgi:glycosyltransferase involved in cell wall biosynthesis